MNSIKVIGYFLIFIIILSMLELLSFTSIYFLQNRYSSLVYDPNLFVRFGTEEHENYSPELGWLALPSETDEIGARINLDVYEFSCIDMFGDSFTYSAEVSKEFAWPKQLSKLIGCKVNNFGVGGYGSDQASLRHELTAAYSRVSVLNHLSENITRNVNQFRNLLYPGPNATVITKPRYVVANNEELVFISKPHLSRDDLFDLNLLRRKLEHEYFMPGGESGIKSEITFPYLLSAVDLIQNHYHIKAKIVGRTRHSAFYEHSHRSGALTLTSKIFDKFIRNSESRGQLPVITIIPTCRDLEEFSRIGELPYQSLLDDLSLKGQPYHDFAPDFLSESDFHQFFNSCSAHPNEEGYSLIAKSFARFLGKHDALFENISRK